MKVSRTKQTAKWLKVIYKDKVKYACENCHSINEKGLIEFSLSETKFCPFCGFRMIK